MRKYSFLGADHKKSMALQTETLKVGPNEFRGVSTVYILDTFSSCNIVLNLKKKKLDFFCPQVRELLLAPSRPPLRLRSSSELLEGGLKDK